MAILYQTTKFKSANIFAMAIWAQPPNLIPANISIIIYDNNMANRPVLAKPNWLHTT